MTRLVIPATIVKVEERFDRHWHSGSGDKAEFEKISLGWWVVIDKLAIHVGFARPDFVAGQLVKLAIESVAEENPKS